MNLDKQTLTVSNDWLDAAARVTTDTVSNVSSRRLNASICYSNGGYNYSYVVPWTYSWAPKIQLKLSEIEQLRQIAKDDASIKGILNKFTQHIEVVVDF